MPVAPRESARTPLRTVPVGDGPIAPMAVSLVDGVLLSHQSAAELAEALDALASFAKQHGAKLPAHLNELRAALRDSRTRVETRGASRSVTAALEAGHTELGLIDTAAAASQLNIAEDSVRDLCRRKRLAAMRIEGRWWIAEDSATTYANERKGA